MEVHHHSHSHGKKNWKAFSWEFIMLFFAVFCGSLAEYYLEHRIENERGGQYIQSMYEDIVSDSIKISASLPFLELQAQGLDTLSRICRGKNLSEEQIKAMYMLVTKYAMNSANVIFTKRTITQLRNSGGMRLIREKPVADAITQYSEWVEILEIQGGHVEKGGLEVMRQQSFKIFDLHLLKGVSAGNPDSNSEADKTLQLITSNQESISEFANNAYYSSLILKNYIRMIKEVNGQIPQILDGLRTAKS